VFLLRASWIVLLGRARVAWACAILIAFGCGPERDPGAKTHGAPRSASEIFEAICLGEPLPLVEACLDARPRSEARVWRSLVDALRADVCTQGDVPHVESPAEARDVVPGLIGAQDIPLTLILAAMNHSAVEVRAVARDAALARGDLTPSWFLDCYSCVPQQNMRLRLSILDTLTRMGVGTDALGPASQALKAEGAAFRWQVVRLLGNVREGTGARRLLLEAAQSDRDAEVRLEAAFVLMRIGVAPGDDEARTVCSEIAAAISSQDVYRLRVRALRGLLALEKQAVPCGSPDLSSALREALLDRSPLDYMSGHTGPEEVALLAVDVSSHLQYVRTLAWAREDALSDSARVAASLALLESDESHDIPCSAIIPRGLLVDSHYVILKVLRHLEHCGPDLVAARPAIAEVARKPALRRHLVESLLKAGRPGWDELRNMIGSERHAEAGLALQQLVQDLASPRARAYIAD